MHRVVLAAVVLLALATVSAPAATRKAKSIATPVPGPAAPSGPMGYYLMQGNIIISQPYQNVADCYKDLAAVKKSLQPGTDTVVCVHRHP
jgi:hypothetical protein